MAPQKTVGQHVARGAAGAIRRQRSQINKHRSCAPARSRSRALVPTAERQQQQQQSGLESADEATRKFGLEAGLWSVFRGNSSNQSRTEQAKELLKRYGSAYLATSITLSIISFSLFYVLISYGIDVSALLGKVGLVVQAESTTEKVGTAALAYAAHKAASPIRFPPTVALTPVVAQWIGKKPTAETSGTEDNNNDGQQ